MHPRSGRRKPSWLLYWNQAFLHFTLFYFIYKTAVGCKEVNGNCEESHLVMWTSDRSEARAVEEASGKPWVLTGLRKGIVWAWFLRGNILYSNLKTASLFFSFPQSQSSHLPTPFEYFLLWFPSHKRRTRNEEAEMLSKQPPVSTVTQNTSSLHQLGLDLVSARCWKDHSVISSQREPAYRVLAQVSAYYTTSLRSSQGSCPSRAP